MFKKYIAIFLIICIIFIIHQSIILRLDARFNFWPAMIIFLIIIFGLRLGLIYSLAWGFLIDLYSPLPFGTFLIIFFLIAVICYFLAKNFFTDRSLLSFLILGLLATTLNYFLLFYTKDIYLGFRNVFFLIL